MSSYDARIRERTVSLEGRGFLLSVVRGEKSMFEKQIAMEKETQEPKDKAE